MTMVIKLNPTHGKIIIVKYIQDKVSVWKRSLKTTEVLGIYSGSDFNKLGNNT